MESQSQAQRVKQFTKETSLSPLPTRPTKMDKQSTVFIVKMIIDEVLELMATIEDPVTAKETIAALLQEAKNVTKIPDGCQDSLVIAEQADAFVDINYYMLNAAAKMGVDIDPLFDAVHKANLDKKDSVTGQYRRNEDGKILKPDNWKAPDIEALIVKQMAATSIEKTDEP